MSISRKVSGATRSKTMWLGALVVGLGFVQEQWDLIGPLVQDHPRAAGMALMLLGVAIKVLRFVTKESLQDKAPMQSLDVSAIDDESST